MPEHLRALVVILALATGLFVFARMPVCAMAMTPGDFNRRRNLWLAMTLTAFLAHDFWIYIFIAATILIFTAHRDPNKPALFFFLLFAVPAVSEQITGLGVIDHFFTINYVRLLSLTVLLPAFLYLRKQPDTERFGRLLPDQFLLAYLALNFFLALSATAFTNTLRHSVFYAFIDVFLPYYVASRSLRKLQDFRDTLMAYVMAAFLLGIVGVFEYLKHWQLYSAVDGALGVQWYTTYLLRGDGGGLRAQASTGQPIPFGYAMAVSITLFFFLKRSIPSAAAWHMGLCLLAAGLAASLSRGPWMGAAAGFLVFVATGPSPLLKLSKLGLLALIGLPLLLLSPAGDKFIDLMPFIGTVDASAVTYRQRLLEISIEVIKQNLLFGDLNALANPLMRQLVQGQGIIDLVNTYVAVALGSGLIGLCLFSGFFITAAIGVYRTIRSVPTRDDEYCLLGRTLLSALLCIMVTIFTVSSITVIPVIYWSIAGICVAYLQMLAGSTQPTRAAGTASPGFRGMNPSRAGPTGHGGQPARGTPSRDTTVSPRSREP